jgi:hypothetical protein
MGSEQSITPTYRTSIRCLGDVLHLWGAFYICGWLWLLGYIS